MFNVESKKIVRTKHAEKIDYDTRIFTISWPDVGGLRCVYMGILFVLIYE